MEPAGPATGPPLGSENAGAEVEIIEVCPAKIIALLMKIERPSPDSLTSVIHKVYPCTLILMPRFAIELPEELNKEFRIRIAELYGSRRGAVTDAANEAIKLWLKETKRAVRK